MKYRVIFFRDVKLSVFTYANLNDWERCLVVVDELASTLGREWTIEVLDTTSYELIAYTTRGIK